MFLFTDLKVKTLASAGSVTRKSCLSEGRYTPAKIVDHIIPIKMGGKTLDESNLQSLCWSCHSKKSNNEGSAGFAKK